uniref:Uncharacterized protein n=1 Tax=Picea glauca TaxID=3330 RepID=A0A124GNN5_PICGL|nr:hypothetical protein ABT39_MTgene3922 [Picea glauca]QHR91037.1 hypothetical protein Q903MT_gene5069 [Picea sitchensis]
MAAELRALSYWADHVDPIPYLPRDLKLVDEVGREDQRSRNQSAHGLCQDIPRQRPSSSVKPLYENANSI